MFRIIVGNLGSGKSAYSVIEMLNDKSGRKTYSNIATKGIPNVYHIQPENVISKIIDEKGKCKYDLNMDFWMKQNKPLNVLWDEIHLTASSRQSMSKVNMVISKFIAMGRRITGMDDRGYGTFTFVAQTERTIDVNVRELTSDMIYLKSHWFVDCEDCRYTTITNSEAPAMQRCMSCGSWEIRKRDVQIEVRKFQTWDAYFNFRLGVKGRWHYAHYMITDIQRYYKYYDTLQYKDIWSDYLSS